MKDFATVKDLKDLFARLPDDMLVTVEDPDIALITRRVVNMKIELYQPADAPKAKTVLTLILEK